MAAAERVAELRRARSETTSEELVRSLIQKKCLQTGAIGAITSGASMVPGLGTLTSLTFGVAADIGMTFKMQAELVLEVAAAYKYELNPEEKQRVILLITGISAGSSMVLEKLGQQIAKKATEQLAQKSVLKAIPILGVAASAGTNISFTYLIGQHANAYFSRDETAMGDWAENVRAVSGVDERLLISWLSETTERSWGLVGNTAQGAAGAVVVAGQTTGEVIVVQAGKVRELVTGAGRGAVQGISSTSGKVVEVGKWAGNEVATTANNAAGATIETGKWAAASLSAGAGSAAGAVANTSKKAGRGVASGAKKSGEVVVGTGRNIVTGAGAIAGAAAGAGKKTGERIADSARATKQRIAGASKKIGGVFRSKRSEDENQNANETETEADDT